MNPKPRSLTIFLIRPVARYDVTRIRDHTESASQTPRRRLCNGTARGRTTLSPPQIDVIDDTASDPNTQLPQLVTALSLTRCLQTGAWVSRRIGILLMQGSRGEALPSRNAFPHLSSFFKFDHLPETTNFG